MKLEITNTEQTMLTDAMDLAITSANRAQKNAKQPQLGEVWKSLANDLQALRLKVAQAK